MFSHLHAKEACFAVSVAVTDLNISEFKFEQTLIFKSFLGLNMLDSNRLWFSIMRIDNDKEKDIKPPPPPSFQRQADSCQLLKEEKLYNCHDGSD